MPSPRDIRDEQKLLENYRVSLAHYLRQQSILGISYAPPGVTHGILEARGEIRRIKAILREWDVAVEDHPDDEHLEQGEKVTPASPRDVPQQTNSQHPQRDRNWRVYALVVILTMLVSMVAMVAIIVFVAGDRNLSRIFQNTAAAPTTTLAASSINTSATAGSNSEPRPTSVPATPLLAQIPVTRTVTANPTSSATVTNSTTDAISTTSTTSNANSTTTLTSTATPTPPNAVAISEKLNLRTGPGTDYSIIGTYLKGEALKVKGKTKNSEWVNVTTSNGREGWMFVENLQVNIDLSSVPVVLTPPTLTPILVSPTPQPRQIRPTVTPRQPTMIPTPPTATPQIVRDQQFDGHWRGTISGGGIIDFTVKDGIVITLIIENCDGGVRGGAVFDANAVVNRQISVKDDFAGYQINGQFDTDNSASGTYSITSVDICPASTGTWSVSRQ